MRKRKTLLPITILCLLGLVACTPTISSSKQEAPSSEAPAASSEVIGSSQNQVSSSEAAPSSEQGPTSSQASPESSAPISSSQPGPSSSSQQQSSSGNSSSEAPIEYGVSIDNKADFADWHAGDNNITLSITLTPAANVKAAINSGELVISSSDPSKVVVNGLVCTANEAGEVVITATYHGKSDSVNVNVQTEDIKTIADIIANGKKDDKITFKGYYLGHNSRINYLGSETYPYVYVGDGQKSMILYCMSRTFLEGIEVGDLVKVTGTYSPYNGLPETASGSVTKFVKVADDPTITRPETTVIDAAHPNFTLSMDNIGSKVHVEGGIITKVNTPTGKSRTDLEPAVDGVAVTTNYFERSYKFKVGDAEYDLAINERYCTPSEDITNLSVGDSVSFDAFVNIPGANQFNFAMPLNIVRVASEKDPVESLTLTASRTKMYSGSNLTLNAVVLPETALQTLEWSSSHPEVATVSDAGVVTAVAPGTTVITAKTVGTPVQEKTVEITVIAPITDPVHAGTEADPFTVDDAVAFTNKLDNKAYSADEIYVEGKVVSSSYSTSYGNYTIWLEDAVGASAFELYSAVLDSTIFADADLNAYYQGSTKDAEGKDIGNLVGHTVICHGYAQKYNSVLELSNKEVSGTKVYPTIVSISAGVLAGITLPETGSVAVGKDTVIPMTVTPIDASKEGIRWSSSNPDVAIVDQNGKVTGVAAGEAIITAQFSEEIKDTCVVTVSNETIHATAIALDKETLEANVGDEVQLAATLTPADAQDEVVWSVSDDTKASVNNGLVKILDEGTITVTVTAGSVSASCTITATYKHGQKITDPLTVAEAVAMVPNQDDTTSEFFYVKGIVSQIDSNDFATSYNNATFWLYNGDVVKGFEGYRLKPASGVDVSNFRVGAEVIIRCTLKNYKGTVENGSGELVSVVFTAIPATAIVLNKTELALTAGGEEALVATLTPSDATDDIVWTSSDETVATVDATGKVSALAAGTTTITATAGGLSATCAVTVTGAAVSKLNIDLTDKSYQIAKPAAVQETAAQVTIGGKAYNCMNVNNNNGGSAYLFFASKDASGNTLFSNHDAVPGAITKIAVTTTSGASASAQYNIVLSSSEVTSKVTDETHKFVGKGTFEVTAEESANLSYFAISSVLSGYNGQVASIEITYVPSGSSTPDPVEIAQPVGSFSGYAISASDDSNIFVDVALADSKAFVEVGTLLKTTVDFTFDKTTGVVTIPLGGSFGNLTATYDEANNKLTNVAVDGAAAAMLKNNGTLELVAAAKFWDCNGSTAELQAMFKRRYMSGSWQVDSSNADRFVSYENGICGSAMQRRGFSGGAVAVNLAADMDPVEVSNIGFWVYNPGSSDLTLRMWIYKGAGLTNNAELGTVTAVAGQWTYCRMGFTKASIYNFQIADFNNSGVALVFDNIVLF